MFLHDKGGQIVCGLSDDQRVCGTWVCKQTTQQLAKKLAQRFGQPHIVGTNGFCNHGFADKLSLVKCGVHADAVNHCLHDEKGRIVVVWIREDRASHSVGCQGFDSLRTKSSNTESPTSFLTLVAEVIFACAGCRISRPKKEVADALALVPLAEEYVVPLFIDGVILHLDSGSLHTRLWSAPERFPTSFPFVFSRADILFAYTPTFQHQALRRCTF